MEVPAGGVQHAQQRGVVLESPGQQVPYALDVLPDADDRKQWGVQQFAPLARCELRPDDNVDQAGFILNGHEDHALRGLGALTHGHQPASPRQPAVRAAGQLFGRREAQLRKLGAVRAYAMTKAVSPKASLNLLWALEGALTGKDWKDVAESERASLLMALDDAMRHMAG